MIWAFFDSLSLALALVLKHFILNNKCYEIRHHYGWVHVVRMEEMHWSVGNAHVQWRSLFPDDEKIMMPSVRILINPSAFDEKDA